MPNSGIAEIYFIAIMMFLILIVCTVATVVFFRQYNREMKAKEEAKILKAKQKELEKHQENQQENQNI